MNTNPSSGTREPRRQAKDKDYNPADLNGRLFLGNPDMVEPFTLDDPDAYFLHREERLSGLLRYRHERRMRLARNKAYSRDVEINTLEYRYSRLFHDTLVQAALLHQFSHLFRQGYGMVDVLEGFEEVRGAGIYQAARAVQEVMLNEGVRREILSIAGDRLDVPGLDQLLESGRVFDRGLASDVINGLGRSGFLFLILSPTSCRLARMGHHERNKDNLVALMDDPFGEGGLDIHGLRPLYLFVRDERVIVDWCVWFHAWQKLLYRLARTTGRVPFGYREDYLGEADRDMVDREVSAETGTLHALTGHGDAREAGTRAASAPGPGAAADPPFRFEGRIAEFLRLMVALIEAGKFSGTDNRREQLIEATARAWGVKLPRKWTSNLSKATNTQSAMSGDTFAELDRSWRSYVSRTQENRFKD